jgi:hypothetical protein
MEVQCLRVKLREGTTDYVINWVKELYNKMDLVYDALISETMVVESMFLERGEEADYLIFYTRAESLQKANEMMLKSNNPVDKAALEMMQKAWESCQVLEILFDVDRIEKVNNDINTLK